MRRFWSYGPPDTDLHYYVPRQELIDKALFNLIGEKPEKDGHYITVWAPRQRGKTWIMENVLFTLRDDPAYATYDVIHIPLESSKLETDVNKIIQNLINEILEKLGHKIEGLKTPLDLEYVFSRNILSKPLILILDEFDALVPEAINGIVSVFRNIHFRRRQQIDKPSAERDYLLHGVALIGVRAVLGLENKSGSPFNIQHSIQIPNLTFEEVELMFKWYERESGQPVEQTVIERVFYETNGQPGLVGWLGELLTETYNKQKNSPITITNFNRAFLWAIDGLGNANILNIISKASQTQYRETILTLFETEEKRRFRYDNPHLSFLYLNGVVDIEENVDLDELYVKFASPFIQKRLFNYFADEIFGREGQLYPPFTDLSQTINKDSLTIKNLLTLHEAYLQKNKTWLLQDAPRRKDLRVYEAIYHFNLYNYLSRFIRRHGGQVWPEFPTGNGQVDLIIHYAGQVYALEVKSFTDDYEYKKGLVQAARYAHKMGLEKITLVLFIENVDETNRKKYEVPYIHKATGVTVEPLFVVTG